VAAHRADDATQLIWGRMRDFAAEQGGLRATALFAQFDKDGSGTVRLAP